MRISLFVLSIVLAVVTGTRAADDRTLSGPKWNVTIQLIELDQRVLSDAGIDVSHPEAEIPADVVKGLKRTLDDLRKSKKLKVIAEPTLLVTANQKGTLFSGGEVAVPVPASDGKMTEEMREFGTRAEATPTPQPDGRVKLDWYISQVTRDYSRAVRFNGKQIPGFHARRLQGNDTVTLGQSLPKFLVGENKQALLTLINVEEVVQ